MFYGLDWIATVPPTVRLAARCFGEDNAPVMFGWIAAMHQLGAAAAAWSAGVVRVGTGSYMAAFMAAGALCLVASVMVVFIGGERAAGDKQAGDKRAGAGGEMDGAPA